MTEISWSGDVHGARDDGRSDRVRPRRDGDSPPWGWPAVLSDGNRSVASLIMPSTPNDKRWGVTFSAGGESIDQSVTNYLRRGFGLVTSLDVATLRKLPHAWDWQAHLVDSGATLRITAEKRAPYARLVGLRAPEPWHEMLDESASLLVLVCGDLGADESVLPVLDRTRLAGRLVGAHIPLGA